ncbi:MAG: AzlD domain-containing protein [Erysipelotrichaceae bacterium]
MKPVIIIFVVAIITLLTRALPFLIFKDKDKTPSIIIELGQVLPMALIAMLVVYCLKDINVLADNHGLPYILSVISVILLQSWIKNTYLSIGLSTLFHMFLLQCIF